MTTTLDWPTKVRVRHSVCDVIDVAVSAQRTWLLVYSPRPIFHGKGDTWVDLADTAPPTEAEINHDARIRSDLPYKAPQPLCPERPSQPAWLVEGALVKVAEWVGQIIEVAISKQRIMVRVESPKGILRHHPPEWLEYVPELIEPATVEQAVQDIELHRQRIQTMETDLEALRVRWLKS